MRSTLLLALVACADPAPDAPSDPADEPVDTSVVDTPSDTGGPVDTHACANGATAFAVGTGVTEFVPLSEGDDVIMVNGPQTGWHIDIGGRLEQSAQLVSIDVAVYDDEGWLPFGDQAETRMALVGWDEEQCAGSFYGIRAFSATELDLATLCALDGQPAVLEVTVTDMQSTNPTPVTATLDVRFALDPNDVASCN